jgi:hypothetical protein
MSRTPATLHEYTPPPWSHLLQENPGDGKEWAASKEPATWSGARVRKLRLWEDDTLTVVHHGKGKACTQDGADQ